MDKRDPAILPSEFDRLTVSERMGAVRFDVLVRPRSSRSAVLGVRNGALDVAVTAPPADGEANSEVISVLAKALGVRRGGVSIVVGASSRDKLVEVNGMSADEARSKLSQAKR